MARAIQVAEETADEEWAGADAHLALAEIALRAGETDLALTALASALDSEPEDPRVRRAASSLLEGSARRSECLDRTWRSRRGSSGFRPEPREPEQEHRGPRGGLAPRSTSTCATAGAYRTVKRPHCAVQRG
jgi:Tetratricopeptide repeat